MISVLVVGGLLAPKDHKTKVPWQIKHAGYLTREVERGGVCEPILSRPAELRANLGRLVFNLQTIS